jgi:glutamyl-tRNA synthetase
MNPFLKIDSWLDFVQESLLQTTDFKVLSSAFETLNKHLALRSYMTGYSLSLADLAVWGALQGIPVFKKNLKIQGKDVNLTRWFQHLASLDTFQAAAAEIEGPKSGNKKVIFGISTDLTELVRAFGRGSGTPRV